MAKAFPPASTSSMAMATASTKAFRTELTETALASTKALRSPGPTSVALSSAEEDADPSGLLLDASELMLPVTVLSGPDAPPPPPLLAPACFNALYEIPVTSRTCYGCSSV